MNYFTEIKLEFDKAMIAECRMMMVEYNKLLTLNFKAKSHTDVYLFL